ncbi:hypothetical protein JTB14_026712 [Gonioctena quinquepunctata]|nr:hypothetical protein JTB14_026712 [Gonioctena quinquepunctata]
MPGHPGKETPSKAAARRLYRAQIKLTYFNEGTPKDIIHYQHLKYLLGGATLTTEHPTLQGEGPNRFLGLIKYPIDINDDAQGTLSATFQFSDIHLMHSTIPLPWFAYFIKVFLRAADTYDLLQTPHLVLIKAIAHIAYERYGPHMTTWKRPATKELSFKTVRRHFARRRRDAGRYWKLLGALEPLQVINAIEGTRHSGISIFNSGTMTPPRYNRELFVNYVYQYFNYFPAFPITKLKRSMLQWFAVRLHDRINATFDVGGDTTDADDYDDDADDDDDDDDNDENPTHHRQPILPRTPAAAAPLPLSPQPGPSSASRTPPARRRLRPRLPKLLMNLTRISISPRSASSPSLLHSPPTPPSPEFKTKKRK